MVGGYLRDGAIHVHGGTVTTPFVKLGITSGYTGTYTQDGGTVNVTTFGVGNDGTTSAGAGVGVATISGGTFNSGNLVFGSSAGGHGTMTLAAGAGLTLKTATISFNGTNLNTSQLNLNDNKLVTTTTPTGSLNGSSYAGVTGMVQSGRNGGAWTGSGIVTSLTQATTSNYTSIGVAKASDVRPATATATALWAGQTITGTDTLVMYTYGGDATLDGKINIDDYVKIDTGIASGLTGWSNGDFNYDGKVNIDDYTTVIDANIGNQSGVFPTGSGVGESISVVAVPEPTLLGLTLGGTALLIRRRRVASGPA
jgi:hypothetical protein